MRINWKICEDSPNYKVFRARVMNYECRLINYGDSESYTIHRVGVSINLMNKMIVSSDISSIGIPNIKHEIQEVMACILNDVEPYSRTMALSRFKYYPEHLNAKISNNSKVVRGYTIGGLYQTSDSKDYYKLIDVVNTSKDAIAMSLPISLYFKNIVSDESIILTSKDFTRLKFQRVIK